ncbi:MAG: hypothetical protein NTV34_03500 [Proteobacteria bacterium]|nr:hypothetical protein [Pseudomonadota bacterium]
MRWGLSAIKGIGAAAVRPLIEDRKKHGAFKSLADMAKRVDLHADAGKKTLELLVKTGAFDSFGLPRDTMIRIIPDLVKFSESKHSNQKRGQRSLFDLGNSDEQTSEFADHDVSPQWVGHRGAKVTATLEALEEERKLTGIYMTGHPIDFYAHDVQRFGKSSLLQASQLAGQGAFTMVAIIQGTNERIAKNGSRLCYVALEDKSGRIEAIMGEKDLPQAFPVPGTPVVVQGKISKFPDGTISSRVKLMRVISLEEVRQQSIKKLTITFDVRSGASKASRTEMTSGASLSSETTSSLKTQIQKLHTEIGRRTGPTELYLEVIYPSSTVALKAAQGVELTDKLIRTIKELSQKGLTCTGRYG